MAINSKRIKPRQEGTTREKMIRQGCRGDPWGRDQKVKKEPTRPGKNRETSVKPWWKRDPKIRGSEGVAYDALEHEEV